MIGEPSAKTMSLRPEQPCPCSLCGRPFGLRQLTKHHCRPREKGGTTEDVELQVWSAAAGLPLMLVRRPSLYAIGAVGAAAADILLAVLLRRSLFEAALLFPMLYLLYLWYLYSTGTLTMMQINLQSLSLLSKLGLLSGELQTRVM